MSFFLRDTSRSSDPAFWEAYGESKAELERLRHSDDQLTRLRLLGAVGSYARLVDRLDESLELLREALALSRALHLKGFEAANLIRLGTTCQYAGQSFDAEKCFREALELSESPEAREYRDFAWQHLGKLLAETGLYGAARQCFEAALLLRRQKGDTSLIHSTLQALDMLNTLSPSDTPHANPVDPHAF